MRAAEDGPCCPLGGSWKCHTAMWQHVSLRRYEARCRRVTVSELASEALVHTRMAVAAQCQVIDMELTPFRRLFDVLNYHLYLYNSNRVL